MSTHSVSALLQRGKIFTTAIERSTLPEPSKITGDESRILLPVLSFFNFPVSLSAFILGGLMALTFHGSVGNADLFSAVFAIIAGTISGAVACVCGGLELTAVACLWTSNSTNRMFLAVSCINLRLSLMTILAVGSVWARLAVE